ncbi:HAD family hydrolase [Hyphomonas sp.]|uniref:HAD family hydrolase n=1 Tax=Hyphomonas sp. TaxID=87 RepID=UPI003001E668|tara:strand:- start:1704 stop:2384 length:681 start_codon:yes stop_codon:yes gene_type:complete
MSKPFDGWTIVFDLDGTLVNTAPDLLEALNHVLTQADFAPVTLDTIETMIGQGARAMIVQGLLAHGVTPSDSDLDAFLEQFLDYYAANIADHSHAFEGAVEALTGLADRGAILAVCTNKKQSLTDQLLAELGLANHFAAIVGADSVPSRKPDGDHILRTIQAAGGSAERALMVGDSRTDERAARNAGLPFIFVPFGYEEESSEQLKPDIVLEHYSGLIAVLENWIS